MRDPINSGQTRWRSTVETETVAESGEERNPCVITKFSLGVTNERADARRDGRRLKSNGVGVRMPSKASRVLYKTLHFDELPVDIPYADEPKKSGRHLAFRGQHLLVAYGGVLSLCCSRRGLVVL